MKAVNMTRYALLGEKIGQACTVLARTKGLLGSGALRPGEGLWLLPCRGIHSIGMTYEFDAVFLDRDGRVVGAYRRFRRNRISRMHWRARGVLELPAGTIERTATQVGDLVEFQDGDGGIP
jgi:uncharacterized membrane protein (UPF0127 family)